jgi:hypothetical protein
MARSLAAISAANVLEGKRRQVASTRAVENLVMNLDDDDDFTSKVCLLLWCALCCTR